MEPSERTDDKVVPALLRGGAGCLGFFLGMAAGLATLSLLFRDDMFWVLVGFLPAVIIGAAVGLFCASRTAKFLLTGGKLAVRVPKRIAIAGGILCIPLLIVWQANRVLTTIDTGPPDDVILATFKAHESELQKIVSMTDNDPRLLYLDDTGFRTTDSLIIGMDSARVNEYRRVCVEAGKVKSFSVNEDSREIDFEYWWNSGYDDFTAKGIAFLPKPPQRTFSSLDDPQGWRETGSVYRHIRGNWYLYFEYSFD